MVQQISLKKNLEEHQICLNFLKEIDLAKLTLKCYLLVSKLYYPFLFIIIKILFLLFSSYLQLINTDRLLLYLKCDSVTYFFWGGGVKQGMPKTKSRDSKMKD